MKFLKLTVIICLIGSSLGILIGYLGHIHPAFDTFAHFRLHASLGLIFLAILVLIKRWLIIGILSLIIGFLGLYNSKSGIPLTAVHQANDPSKPTYSFLHFNLYWINENPSAVIDRILELNPDLISLNEAAEVWTEQIKRLDKKWPYLLHCPEWENSGGIRFYSKWPLDTSSQYCGPYGSLARTDVTSPEGIVFSSGSVHLRWPWPASGPKQLQTITPELRKIKANALLAGDFNATTWSHTVKSFAQNSNMKIIEGIGPTWIFAEFPIQYTWWAGLPIDNVLNKGQIKVLSAKTLEDLGSDHLPIQVKFQFN